MKILILNLARLGDLIQTSPLMEGLKETYPDSEITILSNVKFHHICRYIPFIDKVIPFDVAQFGRQDSEEIAVLPIYQYLDQLTRDLESKGFDMLINLSHSKLSGMMASLVNIPDVRGFSATKMGYRHIKNPWLVYFSNILQYRKTNRFNLVDLYMMAGGVKPNRKLPTIERSLEMRQTAEELLKRYGVGPEDRLVGIQAGSSRTDRRWSPEKFARVADHLVRQKGIKPVLLGVKSEEELGRTIEAAMDLQSINLIGKTSLEELIGVVDRCEAVVTNDTGTMHVAAACETPAVALFLAHAWAHETGPYGPGHLVLEADISCAPCNHQTHCTHTVCLDYVTVEDVCNAVSLILGTKEERKRILDDPNSFSQVLVFESRYDDLNFIDYFPVRKRPVSKDELYSLIYKRMWVEVLQDLDSQQTIGDRKTVVETMGQSVFRILNQYYDGTIPDEVFHSMDQDGAGWEQLTKLIKQGVDLSQELIYLARDTIRNTNKIKELGGKIQSLDQEIETNCLTNPVSFPITKLYLFKHSNVDEEDLLRLAEKTKGLYENFYDRMELFQQSLSHLLSLVRPSSIQEPAVSQI